MASYDPDFHGTGPAGAFDAVGAEPRRHGCLFYGVVALVVVAVVVTVGLALAAWVSYRTIVRYRDMYTSASPVALPRLTTSDRQRQRAVERVEAFRDAVEAGKAVDPLVLSGDDLNALIQGSPKLKDRVYLSLDGDRIKAQVSIPLSEIQDLALLRGRYLNGEAEVKLELDDGRLKLEILSMRAEGKELPPIVRDVLTHSDFVLEGEEHEADTEDEREFKRFLRRLDSLKVEDGELTVTPRPPD
ncbi:hypothetical protein [Paludisphaera sp.]|uniref:hypothetical protein n=1 Tax=Paludisphaera sp. TaxID=2017432 RepID=UPI00301D16E7